MTIAVDLARKATKQTNKTCFCVVMLMVETVEDFAISCIMKVFYDFLVTVKAAPHECVIRTGQPWT